MYLDNQFSYDMLSDVLTAINNGEDVEEQLGRLTDVERFYLKALVNMTPEQQEEWVNNG
jgi:hypothetical protein